MKSLRTFLFLLLTMTSLFQAHGVVWMDMDGTLYPGGPPKDILNSTKRQKDLNKKIGQSVDQTFYGDQNSDGRIITVSLHQKIQVVLTLPDDQENGELTHQYRLMGDRSAEAPLQYISHDDTFEKKGFVTNYDKFYNHDGLHPLELQTGVTMGFCVVANQVSPPGSRYFLTFRLYDFRLKPEVSRVQYQQQAGFKTITWYVNVEEPTAPAESSRVE